MVRVTEAVPVNGANLRLKPACVNSNGLLLACRPKIQIAAQSEVLA
jgi:hypothetical protein